ncbi:MAG: hypothetical protein M5U26_01330 [Planctomycetota bacterium]|nr:hypothetical protein [Planctomycetota bacterium]
MRTTALAGPRRTENPLSRGMRWLEVAALLAFALPIAAAARAGEADLAVEIRPLPPTGFESTSNAKTNALYADRFVYWDDDPTGQFLLSFLGADWKDKPIGLALKDAAGAEVWTHKLAAAQQPKAALILRLGALKPGAYKLEATLQAEPPLTLEASFLREAKKFPSVPFPKDGLEIEVEPQVHLAAAAWPITTGIPLPQGLLTDLARLELLEDGKPVPCQLEAASTWHPGPGASIRWARLSFTARYAAGKPRAYRLRLHEKPVERPKAALSLAESPEAFTVQSGELKFEVLRKGFNGIQRAWFDADADGRFADSELVVDATATKVAGPYLIDQRHVRFDALQDPEASVEVEERGPVRVVIAAKGWYFNKDVSEQAGSPRLCRFVTRLTAYAGRSEVRVQNFTELTFDTDDMRLRDVGFRVPTVASSAWAAGLDGKELAEPFTAPEDGVFFHQYRWNKTRVVKTKDARGVETESPLVEGEKTDGWFSVRFGKEEPAVPCLTLLAKDLWEKFPKEVVLRPNDVRVHAWPMHGIRTFSDEENYGRNDIYKLRFFHEGLLLDLRFPTRAYEALKEIDRKTRWDPENMAEHALGGNAQGLSLRSEFALRFPRLQRPRRARRGPARAPESPRPRPRRLERRLSRPRQRSPPRPRDLPLGRGLARSRLPGPSAQHR